MLSSASQGLEWNTCDQNSLDLELLYKLAKKIPMPTGPRRYPHWKLDTVRSTPHCDMKMKSRLVKPLPKPMCHAKISRLPPKFRAASTAITKPKPRSSVHSSICSCPMSERMIEVLAS